MGGAVELSIVVAWKDRDELADSLVAHRPVLDHLARERGRGAELVLVDCGGEPGRLERVVATAREREPALERLAARRVHVDGIEGFDKSLALNLGASVAAGRRLFFLDADVTVEADFLPAALARLDAEPCFVTVERVLESAALEAAGDGDRVEVDDEADAADEAGAGTAPSPVVAMAHLFEFVRADGRSVRLESNRVRFADGSRSGPGLVVLERDDFLAVGGLCSDLDGWGWEDLDLVARLELERGLARRPLGTAVHRSHGDDVRDLRGPTRAASEGLNFARCLANYRTGHFLGTYADDVAARGDGLRIEPAF